MMNEQVFAQAALLAGQLEEQKLDLLRILCRAAVTGLRSRLKEGITAEDCGADFVAAASLFALAALNEAGGSDRVEEFRAGDLTVRRQGSSDTVSQCLLRQAEGIIQPFLQDSFSFRGV